MVPKNSAGRKTPELRLVLQGKIWPALDEKRQSSALFPGCKWGLKLTPSMLGERNGGQLFSTSPTLSPPPRSVKRRYAAAYAATAFQIALTTNRRPGSLNAYRGQTPRCARLRDVHRLHSEQCKGEFFPCTGLKILALGTPNGRLSANPLVCTRAKSGQQYVHMQLWRSMDAA